MPQSRPVDARSPAVPARRPSPRPAPLPHSDVEGTAAPAGAPGEDVDADSRVTRSAGPGTREPNVVAELPGDGADQDGAAQDGADQDGADQDGADQDGAAAGKAAAPREERPADRVDVWELVRSTQAGDAEAFGRLYDHYVTLVHRYVLHRVGDRAQAEDFTSETFVRALRGIDSLSFQGHDVAAWLVTIARNLIRDHVKSGRFRLEVVTADMRDADRATDGPEDAVVARLTNEQLLACIRQLGGEQQECISLRFLQGLSVSETAAVMGKKDGAVKALQHRAVRRLAGLLPEGLR
ncbi:sigma-70 family RNA polymerase sigma factor [Geodermatophilus sp. URMC 62]|uniref:sigma-70 family RNA polymerase sigma factor n=1 Tax=Geodermatophilus sp. URMC 62 TaxID=3423414 RepID=UPI00406C3823